MAVEDEIIRQITEQATNYATRHAIRAVLDVERSLLPWDVKTHVLGHFEPITFRFMFARTDVSFTVRGQTFKYRVRHDASDFRSRLFPTP